MSPASRSKSKDKRAAAKEPYKSSTKTTLNLNTGGGIPASGYNPLLGTFHTLDPAPVSSAPSLHINSRSRNFDDTEDHNGNFIGIGTEYDCLSNNGSWSGESEDHKEKTSQAPSRQETIPGVDNDKREKIRQKNEKKHQRQKERRAQELHERCSGYLMSRKLEALSQQLVAMGFSSERATMALILNEGRVEQSVAWLFEGGEDGDNQMEHHHHHHLDDGGNLKIDISEELARITEMEMKFKCSKQEVERAVVACEGDLDQAAETLKSQKQEPPAVTQKLEETTDSTTVSNNNSKTGQNLSTSRTQSKHSMPPIQPKTDDRDFNYTKMGVTVGDPGIKSLQLLKKIPSNSDWTKQQQITTPFVEKRWPVGGLNPTVSYSLASPLQASPSPAKTESRYAAIGADLKSLQLGSVREPVIVMQRPKSKHIPASVSSSSSSASLVDWHPNAVEPGLNMNLNPNGFSHVPNCARSFSNQSYGSNVNAQLYDQFHHHHQQQSLTQQQYASSSGPIDQHFSQQGSVTHFNNGGTWNQMAGSTSTPTLAAASSLGLFSGLGSNGLSGPTSSVDWNMGDPLQYDYTNIDWSLDRLPNSSSSSSRPGLWMGWGSSGKTAMRPPTGVLSNGGNGLAMGAVGSEAGGGEWTSPFEEKELFSFPRQFVSSPSL